MLRTIAIVSLMGMASTAAADKSGCPLKSEKDEDREKEVRKYDCFLAAEVADACGTGAVSARKLSDVAVEVCRAGFAKAPELVKEHDALGKRCEEKLGNRSKRKHDDALDVSQCKLLAAKMLYMLSR